MSISDFAQALIDDRAKFIADVIVGRKQSTPKLSTWQFLLVTNLLVLAPGSAGAFR
jgi:hypothetical protein